MIYRETRKVKERDREREREGERDREREREKERERGERQKTKQMFRDLTSLLPAKSGSPVCISTNMHPRLHMSIARS